MEFMGPGSEVVRNSFLPKRGSAWSVADVQCHVRALGGRLFLMGVVASCFFVMSDVLSFSQLWIKIRPKTRVVFLKHIFLPTFFWKTCEIVKLEHAKPFWRFRSGKNQKIFVQPLDVIEMNFDNSPIWAHIVLHLLAAILSGRLFGFFLW